MNFTEFAELYEAKKKAAKDMSKDEFFASLHKAPEKKEPPEMKKVVKDRPASEEAPSEKDKKFDVLVGRTRGPGKETRASFTYKKGRNDVSLKHEMENEQKLFTDFINSMTDPLYEVKGDMPKCPVGYKWNPETKQCVPKTEKDNVNGPDNKKMPYGGNFYNVIGSSGWDGGWAFEENPTPGTEGDAL